MAQRHRTGAEGRPRRSVLAYLVVLLLVPTITVPGFAGQFTVERLREATTARRVGDAMQQIELLDDLRAALATEAMVSGLTSIGRQVGLTTSQIGAIIGPGVVVPTERARADVDEAMDAVRRDAATGRLLRAFRVHVDEVRRSADVASLTSVIEGDPTWSLYLAYEELHRAVEELQDAAVLQVVTGGHGSGSPALLAAFTQLETVTSVAETGNRLGTFLQGLATATGADERSELLGRLQVATETYGERSTLVPGRVSDDVLARWRALEADPEANAFLVFIGALAGADPNEKLSPTTPGLKEAAAQAVVFTDGLRALVADAVAEGVAVARADTVHAERRVRRAVAATVVILGLTITLLVTVGGRIRRRLDELAHAAERLSAGRLELMPVEGPREIALAGAALNDAVTNFRRVALHAEILASGDLDDPVLREPAPGELGAAVHASVERIVGAIREGERLRDELAHQANHDPLTDLPNRAESERRLRGSLARAHRSGGEVAVLFVDLDHFKACNDTLGHAAGDRVLREAAVRMVAAVRPGDTVCRLGGDEFVIILEPAGTEADAVEVAERVTAVLSQPVEVGDQSVRIGGTVGVALAAGELDPGVLLRRADSAMYRAKSTCRGTVGVFDEPPTPRGSSLTGA